MGDPFNAVCNAASLAKQTQDAKGSSEEVQNAAFDALLDNQKIMEDLYGTDHLMYGDVCDDPYIRVTHQVISNQTIRRMKKLTLRLVCFLQLQLFIRFCAVLVKNGKT